MKLTRLTALSVTAAALALTATACKNESKVPVVTQNESKDDDVITTGKVQYSLKSDGRKWKIATDDTQEQMRIIQYILANEDPESVTELFTVTEMTDVNITPPDYFSQFITLLQKRNSNIKVESKIINQQTNSLLGEWWIDGKSPDSTQHEWIRIMRKGNDIAILRYSTKHDEKLEKTRKVWESILNNSKF